MKKDDIISRMAVLWQQRRLVRTTKEFNDAEITRQFSYGDTTPENLVHHTLAHPEGYATWENVIIGEILKEEGCGNDRNEIIKWQEVLDSCIKDGFIYAEPNQNYNPNLPAEGNYINDIYSKRRIKVSYDKGVELLNWVYYYFKYIPDNFKQPTQIIITVIIAVSSTVITLLVKSHFPNV